MSLRKIGLLILSFVLVVSSCKKDDDGDDIVVVEVNDRTDQQVIDNDSLVGYLETHYYNSDVFVDNMDPSISELIITELADGETVPDGHTLLKEDVETHDVVYEETDYQYYILRLNQGGGAETPTFANDVRVNYEGYTLDDNVFDSRIIQDIDLITAIYGWKKVFTQFNTSVNYVENNDGTIDFVNHGSGVIFLPSGLSYFSNPQTSIPAYSPLIFKFDLLQTFENDHDNDGVPSHLEDLNNDEDIFVNYEDLTDDTDDDTDGDGNPNYIDADDDGDGVLTKYEDLEDTDLSVDSDGDGDLTNDKNGDGDPTNDDTDGDGIPNYLDSDDTESNQ